MVNPIGLGCDCHTRYQRANYSMPSIENWTVPENNDVAQMSPLQCERDRDINEYESRAIDPD